MEELKEWKPRIILLDDIKSSETYKKIKHTTMDRESSRNCKPRTSFKVENKWSTQVIDTMHMIWFAIASFIKSYISFEKY